MMVASSSFALMRFYATFHGKLVKEDTDPRQLKLAMTQSAVAPMLYAIATGLSLWWPPGTITIQVLVLLLFFLRSPSRLVAHGRSAGR